MNWIQKNQVYLLLLAVVLLASSFALQYYSNSFNQLPTMVDQLKGELMDVEKEFYRVVNNSKTTNIFNKDLGEEELAELDNLPFVLLVYDKEQLIFWNGNMVDLSQAAVNSYPTGANYAQLKNGYYMILKTYYQSTDRGKLDVIGLYLLKTEYGIQNKYLVNEKNPKLSVSDNLNYSISARLDAVQLKGTSSSLYVYLDDQMVWSKRRIIAFILQCICIGLLLFWAYLYAISLARRERQWDGFFLLSIVLLLIKIVTGLFDFPINVRSLSIFQPDNYQGLWFHTPGDLLMVTAFAFLLVSFVRRHMELELPEALENVNPKFIFGGFLVLYLCLTWLGGSLIRNLILYAYSTFNIIEILYVENIIGLLALFFVIYGLFLLGSKISLCLGNLPLDWKERLSVGGWVVCFWVLLHLVIPFHLLSILPMVIVLLFALFMPLIRDKEIGLLTVRYLLFWILTFSLLATILVNSAKVEKEQKQCLVLAKNLVRQENPTTEFLLNDIALNIMSDNIIPQYYTLPYLPENEILQRIKKNYFGKYFTKYDIDIYLFGPNGESLRGIQDIDIDYFNEKIYNHGVKTENDYVYLIANPAGNYSYLSKLKIFTENGGGFLITEVSENEPHKTNVYPELVIQDKYRPASHEEETDYAVYTNKNDSLETFVGEYPYATVIPKVFRISEEYKQIWENNYVHLVYKGDNNKTAIVSKRQKSLLQSVSLFSYIFSFLFIAIILYLFIRSLLFEKGEDMLIRKLLYASLKQRINSVMVLIIILSFLVIGFITIVYFSNRSISNHKDRLNQKQKSILGAVEYELNKLNGDNVISNKLRLGKMIDDVAEIHAMDVSLYDLDGQLLASSVPVLFENGIISKQMNAKAFNSLKLGERQVVHPESIGKLSYMTSYTAVRSKEGRVLAYMSNPYFARERNLKIEISNFLVALINVYVLILLATSFLAILLSNSLTRSLDMIGESLKKVRLGGDNKKLDWPYRDDEIGALVKQYNQTIEELDDSAKLLAKSEREYAWKQMAKQVAHEIKNPLTPMKLSIQHLQRAHRDEDPRAGAMTERVAKTLIEQIDHLARIATEFSSFAQMPEAQEETVELTEMLEGILELYEGNEQGARVVKVLPKEYVWVYADRTQINRVFHNLLRNALQAMQGLDRQAVLIIGLKKEDNMAKMSFTDNGSGIPDEQKELVFAPSFTTKNSGMGLGLAISKSIIENTGGKIWFDSTEGEGTTFYIDLPIRE